MNAPQRQIPNPRIALAHFLRQVESHHCRTADHNPIPLHWNPAAGRLETYAWPCETDSCERVAPSRLESYRRTHQYKGPCCLCSFLNGSLEYTEARIGIVEIVNSDLYRNTSVLNGEYVAVCAKERCGYTLCLERFYSIPDLRLEFFPLREIPAHPQDLAHISDIDPSFRRGDGLYQVMTDVVTRGKSGLTTMSQSAPVVQRSVVFKDLTIGVSEDRFWALFVQCLQCKQVSFRDNFFSNHLCPTSFIRRGPTLGGSHQAARNGVQHDRHPHPYNRPLNRTLTVRLEEIPGDVPEPRYLRQLANLTRRDRNSPEMEDDLEPVMPASDGFDDLSSDFELPTVMEVINGSLPTTHRP